MILTIDIGNSHILFGIAEGEKIVSTFRIATDQIKTSDEYTATLYSVLRTAGTVKSIEHAHSVFSGSIISSVVPPLTATMRVAAERICGKKPLVVGAGMKTGLNIRIENSGELGADMVATAVAAIQKYGAPVIIVDLGTATKLTVLDQNATFVGGAICPGVRVSADAMSACASLLPKVTIEAPAHPIMAGTIECMQSGLVFGAAAMVDGMLARFYEQLGYTPTVLATGGLAPSIAPHCREKLILDENLILDGLRILFEKNER